MPIQLICTICGTQFFEKPSQASNRRTSSKSCFAQLQSQKMSGENNHQYGKRGAARGAAYKGGRFSSAYGYTKVLTQDGYAFERRLAMEKKLGRSLRRDEVVHHINGDKSDNRPENLEPLSRSEHTRHHNFDTPMRRDAVSGQFLPTTILVDGERVSISQLTDRIGISLPAMCRRLRNWPVELAVCAPAGMTLKKAKEVFSNK